ncbi:MAG: hypothetical protein GKR88_20020 [Flavobacteriaceae bacterium]|nr:MAG: hypothetical protein GKR88_20020 [Flavobacteriaceae bacterium]
MKKIKYVLYVFVLSLLVVSCEDDTKSVTNPGTFTLPQEIKVTFTDTNINPQVTEGDSISFRLGMNRAINGRVVVSLNVTSSDGFVEANYPSTVTLEDGQSARYFSITPTDDGTVEAEVYTVSISSINVQFTDGSTRYFAYNENSTRTIRVRDIPSPIVTTVGDITFNFTWSGSSDLDCRILDFPPTTIFDTGYSTTPGESVTLASVTPDGDYVFTVRPWAVSDASITYGIDLVTPTETRPYAGTFMNLTGGWTMEFIVLQVNKTTSGTTVTYTVTQF